MSEKAKIIFEVSTGEKSRAIKRAHQMEMTLSQYIRHLIWQDAVRVVGDVKADAPALGTMPNGIPIVAAEDKSQ